MNVLPNENLDTAEGDEDVEFEFIDDDENISMMDENDTGCIANRIG
jgi:hypothetical protein